jgi:hypothetical protein
MKKETFIKKVQKELDKIKKRATKEEIDKLDFNSFRYDSQVACIYGQMTGDCDSVRATEIKKKTFKEIDGFGDHSGYKFEQQDFKKGKEFTALEKYLFMVNSETHKEIIQYLKGETKEINLNVI